MFVVRSLAVAISFCVITMLGWGSWANTQKLTGRSRWPFQLFYWDYSFGVLLISVVFALTLGSTGTTGQPAIDNLHTAQNSMLLRALASGAIFNLSNILLVVGIDAAGMAVAFPVGVGLALVLGTIISYVQQPRGNPVLIFGGLTLVVLAMVLSTVAQKRLPTGDAKAPLKGVLASIAAGIVQGFFYPQLMRSISPAFQSSPIVPGMLTPYIALVLFAAGIVLSNLIFNVIFMRADGVRFADYFAGSARLHAIGILGGLIWMIALTFNVIASSVAGPAISYALGQGATLVAALWGLLVWREFQHAPAGTSKYIAMMLLAYTLGLSSIAEASR